MIIENVILENTGGGCMVLFIEVEGLGDTKMIGINDECICFYPSKLNEFIFGEDDELEYIDMLDENIDPFKELKNQIGKENAQRIFLFYEALYVF